MAVALADTVDGAINESDVLSLVFLALDTTAAPVCMSLLNLFCLHPSGKVHGNTFADSWTLVLRCVPPGEGGSGPTSRVPTCGNGGHSRGAGYRGTWVCCWG